MKTTPRPVRRLAATVTFAAVAGGLALPLLAASPAQAVQETETRRLQGTDRYGTAAAVAADTFPDGAESVVLATGQDFADALAANGLAGALGAPVLLTLSDRLPDATVDALTDLAPTTVYLMGGTAAVSQSVEDTLAEDYAVERVQGQNRFETAAAAGDEIAATDDGVPATTDDGLGTTDDGLTAILANGLRFPDAVSGGPVAFAGRFPVLLTAADALPEATTTALAELGIEHVVILGGTTVVSDAVESTLEEDYTVERLAGLNRYATNAEVNDYARDTLGFSGPAAYLSTGTAFADALTGGPAAGTATAPLVLTATDTLPDAARQYLVDNGGAIDELIAIGGTAAIAEGTLAAAAAAAQLDTNQTIEVAPADSATFEPSSTPLTSGGARTFTASGLEPGTDYVIAVVDAETVATDADGNAGFSTYSLSDDAATSIESVNGTPTGNAGGIETVQETGTASAEGTLTFVVDGTEPDAIVPVVYEDLDADGELDLVGQVPDEPFGIGGKTTWLPPEAANDTYTGLAVTAFSVEDGYFVAGGDSFFFASTDRFRVGGATITPTQFERMLSVRDTVDVTYFQSQQSLFDVVGDDLPDISGVTASTPSTTDPDLVQVSWTGSSQPDAVYTVFRDDNANGELDDTDTVVSGTSSSTSRQFVEGVTTAVRYIVLPEGGVSETPDTEDDEDGDPITFLSNEIVPGLAFRGLSLGTTVATNAGLGLVNAGDVWMLHFSRDVQVVANASITIVETGGNSVTFTNGTSGSTWSTDGATLTITLGSGADAAPDIAYGENTLVTDLSGVTDAGGTSIDEGGLQDRELEDDGPELMPESTTCDVGETTCTLAFNEPVDETSAEFRFSYDYVPGSPNSLNSIALGADARTITLSFGTGVSATEEIGPAGGAAAVEDDDTQTSTQGRFDFVR